MPLDLSILDDNGPQQPGPPQSVGAPVAGTVDLSLLDDPQANAPAAPKPVKPASVALPATPRLSMDQIRDAATNGVLAVRNGINDLGNAFAHHFMAIPHGTAQAIQNAVDVPLQALPDNPISRKWHADTVSDNAFLRKREQDYQANTGNTIPAYVGATIGEVAPFLMSGGSSALEQAGRPAQMVGDFLADHLPGAFLKGMGRLVGTAGAGATQGALTALAAPVTTSPDYWASKANQIKTGAVVGAIVPSALQVAGMAANGVKNAVMPVVAPEKYVGQQVAKALDGDAQAVLNNLQSYQTLVPGSTPSAAQVGGNTKLLQIEKANRNTVPGAEAFANRESANNAARWQVVNDIAKDDTALQQAIQDRSAATRPMIDKLLSNPATAKPVDVTPVLKQLDALENGSLGTDPVVKSAVKGLRDDLQDAATKTDINKYTWTPSQLKSLNPDAPMVDPGLLDGYRQNVRNFLSKYSSNGAVSSKQEAAFQPIKDTIVNSIEGANPGYKSYLKTFAQKSQPINTMEAAQQLQDLLGGKAQNAEGLPMINSAGYQSAVNRVLNSQPYGVSPQAQGALQSVAEDLQRATRSSALRSPGSDTAYNIQADGALGRFLYGKDFQGSATPAKALGAALGFMVPGGGLKGAAGAYYGLTKLGNFAGSRVNAAAAKLLNDPQALASSLQSALTPQQAAAIPEIVKMLPNVAAYEAARVTPASKPANP